MNTLPPITRLQRVVSWVILQTGWHWAHYLENWLIVRSVNRHLKAFTPEQERLVVSVMNDREDWK